MTRQSMIYSDLEKAVPAIVPEIFYSNTTSAALGESRIDAPSTIETQYTIEAGDSFEGYLSNLDRDWIALSVEAGASYSIGVAGSGNGPVEDTVLILRDADGNKIRSNDDYALDTPYSGLVYQHLNSDDVVFLEVKSKDRSATGAYTLAAYENKNVYEIGLFDYAEGFLGGGADNDVYEMYMYAGETYAIAAWGQGDLAIRDTTLSIGRSVLRADVESDDASNRTEFSIIDFTPDRDGLQQITVGSGNGGYGAYALTVIPEFESHHSNATWSFETDGYYQTVRSARDTDILRFTVEKGEWYTVDLFGTSGFSVANTILRIMNGTGRVIASNDDASSETKYSSVTFQATHKGDYFLSATANAGSDVGLVGFGVFTDSKYTLVDGITWGDDSALPTDDPVLVYLAPDGETVNDEGEIYVSQGFTDAEQALIAGILDGISSFANITFDFTTDEALADFQLARSDLSHRNDLGFMNPQGNTFYSDGVGVLDDDAYWTPEALQKGGFMHHIIAHEIGHGLGLAHPHDYGGSSRPFLGVLEPSSLGRKELNQVPFTVMSYNDWWQGHDSPIPDDFGSGFLTGFGTIDIAALQAIYGANTDHASGRNTYRLQDLNGIETIWDAGGKDTIEYTGANDAIITLLSASLTYTANGGGDISTVENAPVGFIIAQGVEIENASGGAGADRLYGNDLGNILKGGAGKDRLFGESGKDSLYGGAGNDTLFGGKQKDDLFGDDGNDKLFGEQGNDRMNGGAGNDALEGGGGKDRMNGGSGDDSLSGDDGDDRLVGGSGDDTLSAGQGNDVLMGGQGHDRLDGGEDDDTLFGGKGADVLEGQIGDDTLWGEDGDDSLNGGDGDDILYGGAGDDVLHGAQGNDVIYGGDGNDDIDTGTGKDEAHGGAGDDGLVGNRLFGDSGNDTLTGTNGTDLLEGGEDDDILLGLEGVDRLIGGDGNDSLHGGSDDDRLIGGTGDDVLNGGRGDDILNGGGGADIFQFAFSEFDGADTIISFTEQDVLDVSESAATGLDGLIITSLANGNTRIMTDVFDNVWIEIEDLSADLDATDFLFALG